MEKFKKRTLALVLASVVTVAGSFASNNYKNSLLGVTLEGASNGSVNLVLQTRSSYTGNITPNKINQNTYVLMLPEMNSEVSAPTFKDVDAYIDSIDVRTMPYSNNAKGYTKVTIKTFTPSITLSATSQIFIPDKNKTYTDNIYPNRTKSYSNDYYKSAFPTNTTETQINVQNKNNGYQYKQEPETIQKEEPIVEKEPANEIVEPVDYTPTEPSSSKHKSNTNNTIMLLWAFVIILASLFFYNRAKAKIADIAGDSIDLSSDDDIKKEKKTKKRTQIKNAIKTLDSTYTKTFTMPGRSEYTAPLPEQVQTTSSYQEEMEIVDLDELFREHQTQSSQSIEDDENNALEDFLSGFSFDEEFGNTEKTTTEIPEEETFDEELYKNIISNNNIAFNKNDIDCIHQLLGTEINDDTIKNIEKYAVSNPIIQKPSKQKILEDLVTTYTISQNIRFNKDDINALYKLINVELDSDFIKDLRTNPQRTIEIEKEILQSGDKPKKPSQILTLSVKDMLPDLSEALKKQNGKKIESNRKAETIYFSEGYEVSKLNLKEALPDLSIEINNKKSYISKPSASYDIVDNNYNIGERTLSVSSELPDLNDFIANPEKYKEPETQETVVDETALLNNISNVQFKPFYDGTNEFEVLNEIEEAPSVSDLQEEFKQFDNFEIAAEEENLTASSIVEDYDDFKSLYSEDYVDLDKTKEPVKKVQNEIKTQNKIGNKIEEKKKITSDDLIKKIEATKAEREIRKAKIVEQKKLIEENKANSIEPKKTEQSIKCIIDSETFTVISSAKFIDNMGCHLAKGENGYTILGYIGEKLFKIKYYQVLKSEKIQTRLSEKLSDGTTRYIVRIGANKFVVDVNKDSIKHVMDLC